MAELLRQDIAQLGLRDRACLAPYCRDMPTAMNALDCLVHPQIGTEAFPGVVLEALACGRPVIASDLDGIPEAFAACPHGQLVKPESVPELAAALRGEVSRSPATLAEREAMHAKVARRFNLPVIAEQVLRLYHELVGTRGGRRAAAPAPTREE
jgi:glycosyltransferase involved in cell wall biosynthesis